MTTIRRLGPSDQPLLVELIRLYHAVFEMGAAPLPRKAYLQSLLDRPGLTFLVALDHDLVVGGLTAHDLPSPYFEANEVYVYDLAVAADHQRKGIGRQLLTELHRFCHTRGEAEFFLQADLEDTGAIRFYQALGGVQESVFHFSFDTKRPGPLLH